MIDLKHSWFFFVIALEVSGSSLFADTCAQIGDPVAEFLPKSFCIPTNPGPIGGQAAITITDESFSVNDPEKIDIILPLSRAVASTPSFSYSTTFTWQTPLDVSSLGVAERGVRFPVVVDRWVDTGRQIVDGFSWILNAEGRATGWEVTEKVVTGVSPGDAMDHYHMTTTGLPVGETVLFAHTLSGGVVIPEPTTWLLALFGIASAAMAGRSGRRRC